MAVASDIATVRDNTNEHTSERFSDELLSVLIDESGVAGASAAVWRRKAAIYADLVTTAEAGATRNLSDLSKHALAMAAEWNTQNEKEIAEANGGKARARTHRIVRA